MYNTIEDKEKEGKREMKLSNNDMVILGAITELVEERERIKKAEKAILKDRINELIAEGIDKELAKVMAKCGL